MADFATLRNEMVERQLRARGLKDERVLEAMRRVPREEFVPPALVEFVYEDSPLPIDEGQTISQPFIVALMTEAAEISAKDRVLEVGTGSGYAAAVLSLVASEVYTIERHASLALAAETRLRQLGYDNVHVRHGDGTLGWPEKAPFDAILVAAGGPEPPRPLVDQLAIGGRLVIPIGPSPRLQRLVRIRREDATNYSQEDLGPVQFVPLIGTEGWGEAGAPAARPAARPAAASVETLVRNGAESFATLEKADLDPLLARIGDARVVLLGEATHGTAEFYEMRARITQALIERKGFTIVAVEADWPDAAHIDHYVRETPVKPPEGKPFARFPTWMWANLQVLSFVHWLRRHNRTLPGDRRAGFFGLDLYSLYASISAVLAYLEQVDPDALRIARKRYGCLSPWEGDPVTYGAAAVSGRFRDCEKEVVAILQDLMSRRLEYASKDANRFLDAFQNARLVANAERYYRAMYYGSRASWNLRDRHMFDTLEGLLEHHGAAARAVVWEHNSHVGDASATEMGTRGEHNVGQLCRQRYGDGAYLIGFGTDHGTVAAASDWDGPMEIKRVRPSLPESYERVCHDTRLPGFFLGLRAPRDPEARKALLEQRLERAIGVIYRPETELESHYFYASLPRQFDEYVWIDETRAVDPLTRAAAAGIPDTFPFGL
jgi:protein-L-isoaspartate(D-aspartate) O-methyltransferase